jgi:hypothetical protein
MYFTTLLSVFLYRIDGGYVSSGLNTVQLTIDVSYIRSLGEGKLGTQNGWVWLECAKNRKTAIGPGFEADSRSHYSFRFSKFIP